MSMQKYPRSPKVLLGGMAHLARLIDKIRMRHAGQIQDYNYLTTGFDKYLLDFLLIKGEDFEKRVLQGGTDEEILAWVKAQTRPLSDQDLREWNERILNGGPKDDGTRQRFQGRLADVAKKRGVPIEKLPPASTWVDLIELDEERL
jgi:Fic family protein